MGPADLRRVTWGLDPATILAAAGLDPDPWQADVLRSTSDRVLLCCARQTGKSTTAAAMAVGVALTEAGALVLLVSPSLRQSSELFRKVVGLLDALGRPVAAVQESSMSLGLANGARLVVLPGSPNLIRGFSSPKLIILDEAALVDDDIYAALHPMLAIGRGRLACLSTPMGKRGQFHRDWTDGSPAWKRFQVTARDCPRIDPTWLAEQRLILGDRWFAQEYLCEFTEGVGQVFSTDSVLAAFSSTEPALFGDGLPAGLDSTASPLFATR